MSGELVARLKAAAPLRALAQAGLGEGGWVVGGAVRDAARDAPITDVDLAVDADPKKWARTLARATGGSPFRLSAEFGTWRVVADADSGEAWTADITTLRAPDIEKDLALRDFTINACAVAVGGDELIDPFGGLGDLAANRLAVVSDVSFSDDPLRLMRAARLAAELGLTIAPDTARLAHALADRAREPAAERIYMELRSLISGPHPIRGIELLAELGIEPVLLPELAALRGIEQGPYHHLDAYEHTIEVLSQAIEIEGGSADEELGAPAAEARRLIAGTLGDGISRAVGLRFAALFHDIGKAGTRMVMPNGRIGFPGHDRTGAEKIDALFSRLRSSRAVSGYVAGLTAGHLRLGFMVHRQPLDDREVHGYLRAAHPWAVDLTILTVADRLATRGRKAGEAISAHLRLASSMLERAVAWELDGPPKLPLDGAELAEELEIEQGPELGRLIAELEADAYAGDLADRNAAIARARELMA